MLRVLLVMLIVFLVSRAVWRLLEGIVEGASGGRSRSGNRAPDRGVAMVRDPVCGTFVTPATAPSFGTGAQMRFFCSENCRRIYQAKSAK